MNSSDAGLAEARRIAAGMTERAEASAQVEVPHYEGLVVAGRYSLVQPLGVGGMGSVWEASDLEGGAHVALKFIHTTHKKKELLSRFEQEAVTLAEIHSRHVVEVRAYGVDPQAGPYIALELLDGEDLGKRLDREGTLSLRDMIQVVVQACTGLATAHAAGIVHRDVKPENIFLEELRGRMFTKLVDFGVAKVTSREGIRALTAPGELLGTLEYMSPEQVLAKGDLDLRADLYSLGVVAYRSLIGQPPFVSDQIGELILQLTTKTPTPPSQLVEHIPKEIDRWFQIALAREPEHRFQNAKEMSDALVSAWASATSNEDDDFEAPLSLSPASIARASAPSMHPSKMPAPRVSIRMPAPDVIVPTRSIPAPAVPKVVTGEIDETLRPNSVIVPDVTELPTTTVPPPALARPRPASIPPLAAVRPRPWESAEVKLFALVGAVIVAACLFFYFATG